MISTVYKGRTVEIQLVSTTDLTGKVTEHLRAIVNGTPQFSFGKYTPAEFAFGEIKRYIDAVDAQAEKVRHRYEADGYIKPTSDFSPSWHAGATTGRLLDAVA